MASNENTRDKSDKPRTTTLDTACLMFMAAYDMALDAAKRAGSSERTHLGESNPPSTGRVVTAAVEALVSAMWKAETLEVSSNNRCVTYYRMFGYSFTTKQLVAAWQWVTNMAMAALREDDAVRNARLLKILWALRDVQVWELRHLDGILVALDPLEGTIAAIGLKGQDRNIWLHNVDTFTTKKDAEAWRKVRPGAWKFYTAYMGEYRLS